MIEAFGIDRAENLWLGRQFSKATGPRREERVLKTRYSATTNYSPAMVSSTWRFYQRQDAPAQLRLSLHQGRTATGQGAVPPPQALHLLLSRPQSHFWAFLFIGQSRLVHFHEFCQLYATVLKMRNDSGQVYSTGNSGHRNIRLLNSRVSTEDF